MSRVNALVWGQTVDLVPWESTLYSLVVTVYTARFNTQQFYVLPTQCVCVYENKQRLFPYTALTDWFV